jgi:cleavage and polyadenylation specificity factor subunit 1
MGNYALLGDALRGLHLIAWNQKKKCFEARSQRLDARAAFACEMLLEAPPAGIGAGGAVGGGLLLALAEEGPRVRIFGYSRQEVEASNGLILLPKVAFHSGATVNQMIRLSVAARAADAGTRLMHRPAIPGGAHGASIPGGAQGALIPGGGHGALISGGAHSTSPAAPLPRQAVLYSTLDGGIGVLCPTEESTFRRLFFLGQKLATTLAHVGGLNPRAFRAHGAGAISEAELSRAADGGLLRRYAMHFANKHTIAKPVTALKG